jgi:hypothetical protein
MRAAYCNVRTLPLLALAVLVLATVPGGRAAALYPERPVKIVVPFAPGGGTDVVARTLAQMMAKDLGVSVIVENIPGAGTIIGTQAVAPTGGGIQHHAGADEPPSLVPGYSDSGPHRSNTQRPGGNEPEQNWHRVRWP